MTKRRHFTDAQKAEAVRMVKEEGATMAELVGTFGASRPSIKSWLDAAGVAAGRGDGATSKERGKRQPGQSLRNTPLALKLEENCRRRCEGRTDLLP